MANLICTYNVTDITSKTNLCNNRTGFTAMYVDGVETLLSTGYTFNTLGEHTVEFVLKDNTIGEKAFMNNYYNLVSVIIPEGVETIETYAFYQCRTLTSITIPLTLKHIGDGAWYDCQSLTSINLPEGLLTIGNYPFMGCYSLTTLELPSTLTSIGYNAFNGAGITELTIPDSVISLGEQEFSACKYLKTVTIPDIESGYEINFKNCSSVENVYLGKGLRVIQDECFRNCTSLKSLVIPEGVTSIGVAAFQSCKSLETIHIPEGVTSIGGSAFVLCESLTSIKLPEGVTSIDVATFKRCYSLTTLELPSTLISIGTYAFEDTTSLTQIITKATTQPSIEAGTFNGVKTGGTLYYPKGSDYSQWLTDVEYRLIDWNGVEVEYKPDEPTIDLEYDKITAPQGGITSTLDIETNGIDDIKIIAPEWVIVTDKGGYYEIEVLPNEEGYRGCEVTIIGNPNKPNKVQQNIIINQFGNEEDMATSIAVYKTRLDYASTGGTQYVQVDYVNPQTVNEPTCSQSWVTIERITSANTIQNGQTVVQVKYGITMAESSFSRQTNVTFSCTDGNGNTISQNKFMLYQSAPVVDLPLPKITLEKTEMEFDSNGEASNFGIKVEYEDATSILEPITSDWITVSELIPMQGQSPYTKRYGIYPSKTTEYREGTVNFRASNENGTATSETLVIKQNAPVVDNEVLVYAFTTTGTVNYDGSSTGISIISLACGYKNAANILEPIVSTDWIVLGDGVVQGGVNYTYGTVIRYPITFEENTGAERIGTVTFIATDAEGNEYTSVTTIKQLAAPSTPEDEPDLPSDSTDETFSPIWKDVGYVFGGVDATYGIYQEVTIRYGEQFVVVDELIFKGRAYAKPDETTATINVNKICQNYLNETRLPFDGAVGTSNSMQTFKLKDEWGNLLHTYTFVNDWSYNELTLGIKTNPIVPYIGDGQKLFFSALAQDTRTIKWGMRYYDGTADYDNTEYITNDFKTVIVAPSRQKYVNTFYFGDKSYSVLPKCKCQYVLYYLNPNGGYDWFPITGRVSRKDKLETYTITQNFNNTTTEFGKKRYLSTINVNYQINTQWLTQEQSDRMWELLESNQVWLHNLEEDKVMPVIITNTEIEHKYKTNSRKMLSYQIDVELSQVRERI